MSDLNLWENPLYSADERIKFAGIEITRLQAELRLHQESAIADKRLAIEALSDEVERLKGYITERDEMLAQYSAEVQRLKRPDMVLVPRQVIAAAKDLIAVKANSNTEFAYKQLCQSLINAEGK